MVDYTTKIGVLKRAIFKFSEKISAGMKRPFHKFAADMCYGVMASKSCVISDIAQELQEETQKINTIERLTRHLDTEIPETVQNNYLDTIKKCGYPFSSAGQMRQRPGPGAPGARCQRSGG